MVDFVATGGYALKVYERFAKIRPGKDGRFRVANPRVAQQYRLNVGTIVEETMVKIRLVRSRHTGQGPTGVVARGGRVLGELEEYFIEGLSPGDTFVFGGEVLRFEAMAQDEAYVSRAHADDPKVPAYMGGKFPLSTYLAARVRDLISQPEAWPALPAQVREWLSIQQWRSLVPLPGELLVETFPRGDKSYLVCYPFEGRLAHQTLGMLLTRRLERARLRPLGFVANEYALAVWSLGDPARAIRTGQLSLAQLFDEDMLGDDLEAWLAESALMKRTFRQCAIISGLIQRRSPGEEKKQRQMTISTDLVYDVLRRHQADHILLRAARQEAASGLLDIRRLATMLTRNQGAYRSRGARSRVPARGAGDAGDRARIRLWRSIGVAARRGGTGERGHAMTRSVADFGDAALAGPRFAPVAPGAGEITVAGVPLVADIAGALYWPEEGLLVVSDLHLEKGSAFAARGVLMPPYDTAATLERLAGLLARYAARIVIALGDNFHDGGGPARLARSDRAQLLELQRGRDWVWIAGNHDPDPREGIGGAFARSLALGPLAFRHEPAAALAHGGNDGGNDGESNGEIAGHLHPAARILQRGRTLTRKCFATDGDAAGDAGVRRLHRRPQHPQHRVPEGVRRPRLHRPSHRRAAALHLRRGAVPGGLKAEALSRERAKRVNPAGTRSRRTSRSSAPSRRSRSRRGCRDRRPSPR